MNICAGLTADTTNFGIRLSDGSQLTIAEGGALMCNTSFTLSRAMVEASDSNAQNRLILQHNAAVISDNGGEIRGDYRLRFDIAVRTDCVAAACALQAFRSQLYFADLPHQLAVADVSVRHNSVLMIPNAYPIKSLIGCGWLRASSVNVNAEVSLIVSKVFLSASSLHFL